MAKKDPYMLDPKEAKERKDNLKMKSGGVFCNKRNKSINKPCGACDGVAALFNTGSKADRQVALNKMAKCNFYMNYVTESDPKNPHVLEIGKKAGVAILDGINTKDWTDIAHPGKGKGRNMEINKTSDGDNNVYNPSPALKQCDWAIPKEALDNLHNLDNIIELLQDSDWREEHLKKISSINMNETFKFRICAHWAGRMEIPIVDVWRHWGGVTQDEVNGKTEMKLTMPTKDDDADGDDDTPFKTEEEENNGNKTLPCFGNPNCFDENDEDECLKCEHLKQCARAVKNLKG